MRWGRLGQQIPTIHQKFFINEGNATKSIYILCIYIVKCEQGDMGRITIWLSYGYPMVILWYSLDVVSTDIGRFCEEKTAFFLKGYYNIHSI